MKYGLMGIVIICSGLFAAVMIAGYVFNKQNGREVQSILADSTEDRTQVITEQDLEGLPDIISQWLVNSKVVGQPPIKVARIKQKGKMRLAAGEKWLDFVSSQVFTVQKPGFVWDVKVKMNPVVTLLGRDELIDGKGSMLIKLFGLLPVVDESGPEINQGSMVRYLAEMIWFPSAALSDSVEWEPIDGFSARGRLVIRDQEVGATFLFNESGEIAEIQADRMMKRDDSYTIEKWHVVIEEHAEMDGFVIPSKARIMWELADGTFEWLHMEIIAVAYE